MTTAAEQTIPVFLAAPPPPFTFGLGVGTFENIFTYYLSVHKALSSRTFIHYPLDMGGGYSEKERAQMSSPWCSGCGNGLGNMLGIRGSEASKPSSVFSARCPVVNCRQRQGEDAGV